MRRDAFVFRTPITLAAATLAAAVALTACGPLRMGAAAILDNNRISTATLTAEVSTLDAAYQADKAKIQLQFAASQAPQEVLSWLLRFRVQEHLAAREGITVTKAQTQQSLASLSAQAKQSGATLTDLAVANGVPPDQITELGRYQAIEDRLVQRLNGGKLPTSSTSSAVLQALSAKYDKAQCLAAKSLAIEVNPQFGRLNYSQLAVIAETNTLSAPQGPPSPKPTGTSAPERFPSW
jgi:lambda repressor-like predicted transcriptional regulator